MGEFGLEGLGDAPQVQVDVYTAAYRVSGMLRTRFSRVSDMLNQQTTTHIPLERATLSEYADPSATLSAHQTLVALDEVLLLVAAVEPEPHPEMAIPKREVRAQLGIPPFRLTGTVHIPHGGRPVDGLVNVSERFLTMTDATITSGPYPELGRAVDAVALRRDRAHVLMVHDDQRPDELLADVLDERTAEFWRRAPTEEAG